MQLLLQAAQVYRTKTKRFEPCDLLIQDGLIQEIGSHNAFDPFHGPSLRLDHFFVAPTFTDIHVHLREPGFSYKGTIASETRSALAGGFAHVLSMPNLKPVPDSIDHLKVQLDLIEQNAACDVTPYAAITEGQEGKTLVDMKALAPYVAGFSDDGRGVQDEAIMRRAFLLAKETGKPIVSHCEVEALLNGGVIHDGAYAKAHALPGICSESEWKMVERDIALVRETGCPYHVCHVSTKETVDLVRQAKKEGLPVTCEVAPHYLYFTDLDLQDYGRFKMNPPIRSKEDQIALIEGLVDGTIDCIATDHAPHSAEEKSRGLLGSSNGVVGFETAFAASYTALVKAGHMDLAQLIDRMAIAPGLFAKGKAPEIAPGEPANLVVLDPEAVEKVDASQFVSAGKATPFDGEMLQGQVLYTISKGEIVWEKERI